MTADRTGATAPGEESRRTVVQLAAANSIFPRQLAEFWQTKGVRSALVTRDPRGPDGGRAFTVVLARHEVMPRGPRGFLRARLIQSSHLIEKALVAPFRASYHRRTGRPRAEGWNPWFVGPLFDAGPLARAASSLEPMFVLGHEVTSYGPALARCRGTAKVLFPWGGDVFLYARTSPFLWLLARSALRSADLVLPSSATAARHIVDRFRVPAHRVRPVSWGVDRSMFRRAAPPERARILAKLGLPPAASIVLNVRQFHPLWGCFVALEAFLKLASGRPDLRFVMLGGVGTEAHVEEARRRIAAAGHAGRFVILDGRAPLATVAELMAVADVFSSLMSAADMRSASVLQATAAGAVPVVTDTDEHREMARQGFAARLVDATDPVAVECAIAALLLAPEAVSGMRQANDLYIARHEDQPAQLERMWQLIRETCAATTAADRLR